jgi:hypothetical protein
MSTTTAEIETRTRGAVEVKTERAKLTVKDFKGKVDPDWHGRMS